jgi:hypothetical protein
MMIKLPLFIGAIPLFAAAPRPVELLTFSNPASIRAYIVQQAKFAGVPPSRALFIVQHESHFDPTMTGDTDKVCPRTGRKQRSRGLWQISDCYHSEVDDATAYSVVRSTVWAMSRLLSKPNEWSTWKFRHRWHARQES